MNAINERLADLESKGTPVAIGLIGAGQMGQEILCQVQLMKGVRVPVVVDVTFDRAELACRMAQLPGERLVRATSPEAAQAAIDSGRIAVATDWQIVPRLKGVQAVVDATGSPELGVSIALECIRGGKHIVMMNVECDVTVGPILNRLAREAGVIYTLAAGDEPAAILELYRFAAALGFEVVAAGKGKNNPLDITATPEGLAARAKARDMSARMLCEFVDGSKTAVEMCSVANATGLVPDVRGMHGAKATRDTLQQVFCPKSQGGVLNRAGVVDFAIGVHPGVFVVFTTDQPRLRHGLIQRDMGQGPNYLLFRPYHLCSIEVPLTAAQTVIYGESSGHPLARPVAECIAISKRPLKAGETLDAIGERCYRGSIDTVEAARQENLLPLGLARGCVLKRDVALGQPIRYDDLEHLPSTPLTELRRRQDELRCIRRLPTMKLIGLDVGTTGCKAMVFDPEGRVLGRGSREYGVICDASAKAEQDAELVWSLTKESLREAVAAAGSEGISALSVSAQGDAIIPVDEDFRPLHPAILGMDYRSGPQAERCATVLGAMALFARTGMRPHPMNSITKVLLLRELSPGVFDRAAKIVTYADFILGKLGGEAAIDYTMASRTMAFDLEAKEWSETIHRALGLDKGIWSKPVPSGTALGRIRRGLAEELGLPSDLELVAGGHDQTCAALGAGVIREGKGVVSTGTAEVLSTALDRPALSEAMFNSFYPCYLHAKVGKYFSFSLNHSGGMVLRWWRDNFATEEVVGAAKRGMEPYRLMDDSMPEGPSPVMLLPHLNGSGTPTCDLQSKGALIGLTLATNRHDVAKAILEGLTFELRVNLETMIDCGMRIEDLVAVGGGAKSARWLQLKADILNRPLRTLRNPEAACLGAALLAGVGTGAYENLEQAVGKTVHYDREFLPQADRVASYSERYATYQQLYPQLRELHSKL